jgi:hypothetical protein
MIITEVTDIDIMAERMFCHVPNLVALEMDDYNQIKSSSTALSATHCDLPLQIETGIDQFEQVIREFNIEGARQILLQISGVSSSFDAHNIRLCEMNSLLRVIESHFGNVEIIWGLSDRKSDDKSDYEVVIIVGYK